MRGPEPVRKGPLQVAGLGARWPAVALLVWAGFASIRQAWAEHLFASGRPEQMRRALELISGRAEFYLGLAEVAERAGEDPIPWLRQAAVLSPADASIRIHLGLREEIAGRVAEAEAQLLEAARLSRKYLPRWTLANFTTARAGRRPSGDGRMRRWRSLTATDGLCLNSAGVSARRRAFCSSESCRRGALC